MKTVKCPKNKEFVFYSSGLDKALMAHLAILSGFSPAPEPRSKLAEIKEVIRRSEIEVEADILEAFRPDPEAKLDLVFEKGGRVFAYYHFDKAGGARRYWQRYRVEGARAVIDAVFPVVAKQGA